VKQARLRANPMLDVEGNRQMTCGCFADVADYRALLNLRYAS
jgi:hypothetical protein